MVLAHTGENVLSCLQLRDGDVDKRGCEREQGDALMGEGGSSLSRWGVLGNKKHSFE